MLRAELPAFCAPDHVSAFTRYGCLLEMKVDVGEAGRKAEAVVEDRQIRQGFTINNNNDTELGRSGSNRAVAVAQQHEQAGIARRSVDGGAAGVDGVIGAGSLPARNGVLSGAGDGSGAAVVALHRQHGVDGRAFVGSDEYRQVGKIDFEIACSLARFFGGTLAFAGLVARS